MFNLKRRELVDLTPSLAEEYLGFNTFQGQRNEKPKWTTELSKIINDGMFLTGDIGIARYKNGSGRYEKYLVNGQHQCKAVLKTGKTVPAVIEVNECETLDDVSLLYRQYDNHQVRSLQDLVKMEMLNLSITDWPVRVASLVVTAATIKEGKRSAHRNDKVEMLKRYLKEGQFIKSILADGPASMPMHLRKGPVACAMMLTWEKCQRDAVEFWTRVRDGENLTRKMPEFKLREFLMMAIVQGGHTSTVKNIVGEKEILAKCITAWNAYRAGASTILKYFPAKPIPRAI